MFFPLLALSLALLAPTVMAHEEHGHEHGCPASDAECLKANRLVLAQVLAINLAQGRIRLQHQAVPDLGMGAMTMGFELAPGLGQAVAVGDAVMFRLERVDGKLKVTALDKVAP